MYPKSARANEERLMPKAYEWELWPEAAKKSEADNMPKEWNVPGVYALVATRAFSRNIFSCLG